VRAQNELDTSTWSIMIMSATTEGPQMSIGFATGKHSRPTILFTDLTAIIDMSLGSCCAALHQPSGFVGCPGYATLLVLSVAAVS
jgi:hypothetical protein